MDFKQGDFENILMNAIWDMEELDYEEIDVSEVQSRINSEEQSWAYTTVKTVLDRLVKKESLERVKFNKKFFYKSIISRKEAGINAIEKLARQYFKGEMRELIKAADKVCAGVLIYR
ncbi:MAG: hypothetical protein A2039_06035 [Candidatus Melainabacteria bacterium GWA2_34_9]|nr:MAG: hypothetical protein A2039_06035 [Candidatus Melainabacteria bacterium GWA2_34_9]